MWGGGGLNHLYIAPAPSRDPVFWNRVGAGMSNTKYATRLAIEIIVEVEHVWYAHYSLVHVYKQTLFVYCVAKFFKV